MDNELTGFVEDMSNADYHASEGVSKSGLDLIDRSPAHYMAREFKSSTRAMTIGTAIHAAILEPEMFKRDYFHTGCIDRVKKLYKHSKKIRGEEVSLTAPESAKVRGMVKSIYNDAESAQILSMDGKSELSAFAIDPETGIKIRCRYDRLTNSGISLDLKKTIDLRKFGRSCFDYRYHVQDAMYSHVYELVTGEKLQNFLFLAVEESAPHACKVFELDEEAKEIGEYYYRKNLVQYAECLNRGDWPTNEINSVIELPYFAAKQYEQDLNSDDLEGFIV